MRTRFHIDETYGRYLGATSPQWHQFQVRIIFIRNGIKRFYLEQFVHRNTFYNNVTGQFHKAGEHILPPQQLCSTYKRLAAKGGDDYYNGELAQDILADLKDLGALVSQDDLETYK